MSAEFRQIHDSFLWGALRDIEPGRHSISKSLHDLYKVLGQVEHACALYEASDSGADAPVMALIENWSDIEKAIDQLRLLKADYKDVVTAAVRSHEFRRTKKGEMI